jgi:hypothetical protein
MKSIMAAVVCILMPMSVFGADIGYKVTYDGGSLPDLKTGSGLHLFIDQYKVRFVEHRKEVASVAASAITEISYGLTKSRKHFVSLTWADGDKKGGLALQCDKNEYRGILAGLESISGKKAVDSAAMTVKN